MARIELPQGTEAESIRLLMVQPDMGGAMAVLADAIYSKSNLDIRVREAIRMRIAQINQCQVCLNFRFPELVDAGIDETFYTQVESWQDSQSLKPKEKLGIQYAERFIADHLAIDDAFFDQLKTSFSNQEIYEMTVTIAGLLANGRVMQVLQVEQSCSL